MAFSSTPLTTPAHAGLSAGAIVGEKYRIDGVLGEGGMGVVFSATHLELGSPVAIKVVRDDLAANEAIVSRLIFEARAAAAMRSAHVVRILDVAWLPSGAPYIVMEQLQGWDLATALAKRGVFSTGEAIGCVLQACDGLSEAHQLGIVHRDLKPENLFLASTPEGVVLKILDFGISKDTSRRPGNRPTLTQGGSAVGSPLYMSPEQMRACPNLDARADIWSLGSILFELLSGSCPFQADSPTELCTKIMVQEAPSLLELRPETPRPLDDIVRRCLQKDPNRRFQTVNELARALHAFLDEQRRNQAEHARREALADTQAGLVQTPPPRAPIKSRATLALFASAAVVAIAVSVLWQESNRAQLVSWISPRHASAAELAQPASRSRPTEPVPVPVHTAAPEAGPATLPSAAPATSTRPTHASPVIARAPVGPRFYVPSNAVPATPKAVTDPASGSISARYGL